MPPMSTRHFLFLLASTREPGHLGNTETLARRAAASLQPDAEQTWLRLADFALPPFVDLRHTAGTYPAPTGDMARLLDATLACTDLVLVTPTYWYSFPSQLKTYLDHWSAWMRVPGVDFKDRMAAKTMHVVTTSGDRAKSQPMLDSARLCAGFLGMRFGGALWGKGGPPGAIDADGTALAEAKTFFADAA